MGDRCVRAGRAKPALIVLAAKSAEEASHYGYRLYQYTSVADKRSQIVLIPQQAEG